MQLKDNVLIIGAGLAGLCCALRLHEAGIPWTVIEAADEVGGRVRTDRTEGFLLDRGFQIFLTAYPEASSILNYAQLDLHPFFPGALVYRGGKFHRLADPLRRPDLALETLLSSVGTLSDKLRVAALRVAASLFGITHSQQYTTMESLRKVGFSQDIIDGFFRPFLSGIFLENELETSASMFNFVFRMLADGENVLPGKGMQSIPLQIANRLPSTCIKLNKRVERLKGNAVETSDGDCFEGKTVVLATDEPNCLNLLGVKTPEKFGSQTCLYFAAGTSPVDEPVLILNGEEEGVVNNLCVPSDVCANYAPAGSTLISVSLVGHCQLADNSLEQAVRLHLSRWFGNQVKTWRHLRTYRIKYALPDQSPQGIRSRQIWYGEQSKIHFCGDYKETGSINGAMYSGRKTAEAIISDLAVM